MYTLAVVATYNYFLFQDYEQDDDVMLQEALQASLIPDLW